MVKTRIWSLVSAVLTAFVLSACGGASFGEGGGLGGTTGGNGGPIGAPAILTVTAAQESIPADGVATVLISAVLTDAAGTPIPNRTLSFAANAGTVTSDSATTNSAGAAEIFLRAPTQRGTGTVTVRESDTGITGSAIVRFVSGAVAQLDAAASPTLLAPGGVSALTIVALDDSDNPVAGEVISFDMQPSPAGRFSQVTVETDDNGRATTTFEAGSITGPVTLRARTASGLNASAQVTIATQAALRLSVTPSQNSVIADGVATVVLSAVLTDSEGIPLPNRTIEFATNAGTLLATSAVTNANGLAEVTLRAPNVRGVANVTVRETGTDVTGATAVEFVAGAASTISVTLTPSTVSPGGTATLVASVRDGRGNPVSEQVVTFDTPNGAGGGQFEESTVTTDGNGRASTDFVAGTSSGTFALRARIAGGTSASAQLTVTQPDALLNVTAAPATLVADGQSTVVVSAVLTDFNDQPLPNRTIVFTTTSGTLLSSSALTNDAGLARVSLRAPAVAGRANVTARLAGGNVSAGTVVEFTAGPAAQISFGLNPSTVQPGGASSVSAIVRDANGNPVSGESVTFSVSPAGNGSFSPGETTTGATGQAGSTFTAGDTTGTFTLSASTGSGLNASAQLTVAVGVTGISVIASAPTLQSSDDTIGEGLRISAIVRKQGNLPVEGVRVNFSASSGLIQPQGGGITDASGSAQAILTTGGDPTNRDITVTASNEGTSSTVTVAVVGTKINLDGPRSIQSGVPNSYVATLTDAVSAPIANRSVSITTSGGTLSASTLTTDAQGKATFSLTAGSGPSVTLQASALGATSGELVVSVTNDSLVFVPPDDGNPATPEPTCAAPQTLTTLGETPLNTTSTLRVLWCRSGAPVPGSPPITFSTTRGTLSAQTPVSGGFATVNIAASESGPVTVQAVGNDTSTNPASTPFASITGEFVATNPATIDVQADPAVIRVNQQSTIRAIVRDAANNLVKNATVTFALNDTTGGSLSGGSAVTDSQGRASVVYTASDTTSAQNGVRITATVNGISKAVFLTVGGQNLRIVLGTGNQIVESDDTTRYELPYTAIVSDAAGNPAPNVQLNLSGFAASYGKGRYVWNGNQWVPQYTIVCPNEDANENGILDPLEDTNGNGILDPSAPAVITPPSPALNASGYAFFDIIYPQDRASWITSYRLTARASAAGTETTERVSFTLPPSAADVSDENVSPPGFVSPFGEVPDCSVPF